MTDLLAAAERLHDTLLKDRVYVWAEPEIPDFTAGLSGKLVIESRGRTEIEFNPGNLRSVVGLLRETIFNKERVQPLLCYNIKPFFTYLRYHLGQETPITTSLVDIRVIENFLNLTRKRPESLIAALNRAGELAREKAWKEIYKKIHIPFILKVLPSIESTALLDEADKIPKFPYYEIEGQANGRLNCFKKFSKGYLPHTIGPDQRHTLKPKGYGQIFMSADYRHCEVTVLQWLSKDEVLKEILDSGEDLHSAIYKMITGDECDTPVKRDKSKKLFLPVMYGRSSHSIAEGLSVKEAVAVEIVNRIHKRFPTCSNWMREQQEHAKHNKQGRDYFGRTRLFQEDEAYLARNFAVQGVAATVCAEKTIQLYNALQSMQSRICYTVHDNYTLVCPLEEAKGLPQILKDVLESESTFCPGLNMKIQIKYGKRLDQMKGFAA